MVKKNAHTHTQLLSYSIVLMMIISKLNNTPMPRPMSRATTSVPKNTTSHTACIAREGEKKVDEKDR